MLRIGDGVAPLRISRTAAVLEIVESVLAHVRVANAAKVDPHVGVLMTKQWREAEVRLTVERSPLLVVGAGPQRPRRGTHRVRWRAKREQIDEHRLVVAVPVELSEPPLGRPRKRYRRRARLRPGPVHPAVELIRELAYLLLARVLPVEVALAEEHPGEQE